MSILNHAVDEKEPRPPELSHWALFVRFLKFGFMAFDGPVAQIRVTRIQIYRDFYKRLKRKAVAAGSGVDLTFAVRSMRVERRR